MEILTPRDVPLGGLRAMTVRRTLPQRQRSLIGAWCFVDHYGPDPVGDDGPGMVVPPHPHTGLATVSWLFSGEIEHRDSAGHHAMVRPGELNLMTAGRGISHSEYSTPDTHVLHGAQLWFALPDGARERAPEFERFAPDQVTGEGWEARVFLGEALGSRSPVATDHPVLGAEIRLSAGATLDLAGDSSYEHGVLVDHGAVRVGGVEVPPGHLLQLSPREPVVLEADDDALLLVLGGPPFGERIVMWWNFIGRDHDEVAAHREQWQAAVTGEGHGSRFSLPEGDPLPPLPAPELPHVRLSPRGP